MAPVDLPTLSIVQSRVAAAPTSDDRERLVRRAKALAWIGVGWHGIEAAIAVGAGVAAGSIALIGFGADSLVEAFAGFIVLWRFADRPRTSARGRASRPAADRHQLLLHRALRRRRSDPLARRSATSPTPAGSASD